MCGSSDHLSASSLNAFVKYDDGDPASLGAWVKGNSGWGQFYWIVEDEAGSRHYSCGQAYPGESSALYDVFDYDGSVSLCYTGWNWLKIPVTSASSIRNLSTGIVGSIWQAHGPKGKLKLAGVAFAAMNRPLFLTERRAYRQCIRIGDIYAFDYAK